MREIKLLTSGRNSLFIKINLQKAKRGKNAKHKSYLAAGLIFLFSISGFTQERVKQTNGISSDLVMTASFEAVNE